MVNPLNTKDSVRRLKEQARRLKAADDRIAREMWDESVRRELKEIIELNDKETE